MLTPYAMLQTPLGHQSPQRWIASPSQPILAAVKAANDSEDFGISAFLCQKAVLAQGFG
jgi:hypothetical protein